MAHIRRSRRASSSVFCVTRAFPPIPARFRHTGSFVSHRLGSLTLADAADYRTTGFEPSLARERWQDGVLSMSGDDKGQRSNPGGISPEDRAAFEQRAASIGDKLNVVKGRKPAASPTTGDNGARKGAAMSRALRISTELIGGIVVGGAIGWGLDRWLGTGKPWFFILFFLLGAAAGIMNVVRMAARDKTPPGPSVPDDDDET
jgi:ATP synthase protein I